MLANFVDQFQNDPSQMRMEKVNLPAGLPSPSVGPLPILWKISLRVRTLSVPTVILALILWTAPWRATCRQPANAYLLLLESFFEMFAGSFGTCLVFHLCGAQLGRRHANDGYQRAYFYRPLPFDGKFVNNKRLRVGGSPPNWALANFSRALLRQGGGLLQRLGVLQSLVRPPAAPRSPAAPWQCGLLQRLAGAPSHDGAPGGRQALGGRAFWALR